MAASSVPPPPSVPPGSILEEIIPDMVLECACGRRVWLGRKRSTGQPMALHHLPTCQLFDENEDLIDYMHALRGHYQKKRGN